MYVLSFAALAPTTHLFTSSRLVADHAANFPTASLAVILVLAFLVSIYRGNMMNP